MKARAIVPVALALLLGAVSPVYGAVATDDDVPAVSGAAGTSEEASGTLAQASPTPSPSPSPAPPGGAPEAPKDAMLFTYGIDRTSWFWEAQINQNPGGPVGQRIRLPNPQRADTLPVAVEDGKPEKESAILFELLSREVPIGAEITEFVLTIMEGRPGPEFPSFNTTDKIIQACRISDFWPAGEAELWEDMPPVDDSACVPGERKAPEDASQPVTWSFDLTEIAAEWGEEPFKNNGVMLVGLAEEEGPTESWQINLKVPERDNSTTEDIDEYEQSKSRAYIVLEFEEPEEGPAPPPPPPPPVGGGSGFPSFGGSAPSGGGATFDTGGGPLYGDTGGTPPAAAGPEVQPPLVPVAGATMPWYVWILIPIALAAAAAVRMTLLEGIAGVRPDGVIAAIRRRNAEAGSAT